MNKITLTIEQSSITPEQFNDVVRFVSSFRTQNGEDSLKWQLNSYPLRLKGKIANLSSLARGYFISLNKSGYMRNISLIKRELTND